jgi:hypothetical protein
VDGNWEWLAFVGITFSNEDFLDVFCFSLVEGMTFGGFVVSESVGASILCGSSGFGRGPSLMRSFGTLVAFAEEEDVDG